MLVPDKCNASTKTRKYKYQISVTSVKRESNKHSINEDKNLQKDSKVKMTKNTNDLCTKYDYYIHKVVLVLKPLVLYNKF